LPDKSRLQEW